MIQYYSPNINFRALLNFFYGSNSREKIVRYFKNYTGKKYILLTHSGRSSLYLAYKALDKEGEVITSPLTCFVAILPLLCAQYKPVFVDIDRDSLNIDASKIEDKISSNTVAIQAIHLGGNSVEITKIRSLALKYNLILIEDCAQAFGATYLNKNVGSFGDVACFSLTKNLFGIVGGILATDSMELYQKAMKIQESFEKASQKFTYYRLFRSWLETNRGKVAGRFLYNLLMKMKNWSVKYVKKDQKSIFYPVLNYLRRPAENSFNITAFQLNRIDYLHKKRINIAKVLKERLNRIQNISFQQTSVENQHSFCKFYIYSDYFNKQDIEYLNKQGIEAKHLEQNYHLFYQERFDRQDLLKENASLQCCINYYDTHDRVISLPLHEEMTNKDIEHISKILERILSRV